MDETDYNATASMLGMGDRFRFTGHGAVLTVRESTPSVDGSVVHLDYADGGRDVVHPYARIHRIECAPRCDCGHRFEHCENGCVWPDALRVCAGL